MPEPTYDIRLNEQEYRDVFSGNVSVSQLSNSILSGRIYVSPWHMQSVYNFASSFRFDQWANYYKDLAARQTEADLHQRCVAHEELKAIIDNMVGLAISQALAETEDSEETKSFRATDSSLPNSEINPVTGTSRQSTLKVGDHTDFEDVPTKILSSPTLSHVAEIANGGQIGKLVDGELKEDSVSLSASAITIIAGSFANSVEALLMHPLDLVKTRFQLASRSSVFGLSSGSSNQFRMTAPLIY